MKININKQNYLQVWLKLILLKLHIDLPKKELEVLEYICKLQPISTEERRLIAKKVGTSYQVVSNTIKKLKDKGLISISKNKDPKVKKSYVYNSNITSPSNIDKLRFRIETIEFIIEEDKIKD